MSAAPKRPGMARTYDTCMCTPSHTRVYIYVHMYIYLYEFMYICTDGIYVYMYICMKYMCVYIQAWCWKADVVSGRAYETAHVVLRAVQAVRVVWRVSQSLPAKALSAALATAP